MTKFISKLAIFALIPAVLVLTIETVFAPTLFTFRTWEAIYSTSPFSLGPFYPNVQYTMIEQGDLAHHTRFAVEKKVTWETDQLGYRNRYYNPAPDILLIGDSNIAGSSLSQEELLASYLELYTGLSVYNLAPAKINTFIQFKNAGLMEPPKVVVFAKTERKLLSLPPVNIGATFVQAEMRMSPFGQSAAIMLDKFQRGHSIQYLKARINGSAGVGIQSTIDENIFYLQGAKAVIKTSGDSLERTIKRIKSYRDYFHSIECEFIFVPIPNKETILWQFVPLNKQPDFITKLNRKLTQNGIITVNTVKLFNNLCEKGNIPYHSDDTHWNKYANREVSKVVARLVSTIAPKVSNKQ